jgi:hypothetical protein
MPVGHIARRRVIGRISLTMASFHWLYLLIFIWHMPPLIQGFDLSESITGSFISVAGENGKYPENRT